MRLYYALTRTIELENTNPTGSQTSAQHVVDGLMVAAI